jgi:hypothetical protein
MMIERKAFEKLTITEQSLEIISRGKLLKSRLDKSYVVNLFLLDELMVEIAYEKQTNSIARVDIVDDDRLNLYL